jgi:hypothetical protein
MIWNLFLDIVCENIGVSRTPVVDQYHSSFSFRIMPVRNMQPRNFYISVNVTGFHCSLRECFVTGVGMVAATCSVYKFVWST